MEFITIFSTPKSFSDPHINTIQRNAIRSWTLLGEDVQTLLIGEEDGQEEIAEELGLRVLADVNRNDSGTPLVNSIFELARNASQSPILIYVNADILLIDDLLQAVHQVNALLAGKPFLMIGQRWDLDVRHQMDFSGDWQSRLRSEVSQNGRLHRPAGSDYFVFPRYIFHDMPAFAIGRAGWDNWMIYNALQRGWPVIDGTPSVMVIHQNHDYSHLPAGKPHYDQIESQNNLEMAGGLANMYMVLDAPLQLVNGHIRSAQVTLPRLIRSVERWLMPKDGNLRSYRGRLTRRMRRLRRRLV